MKKEPDWESLVVGKTQAVDFIGVLVKDWKIMAKQHCDIGREEAAMAYEECAEMLESKIEDLANS